MLELLPLSSLSPFSFASSASFFCIFLFLSFSFPYSSVFLLLLLLSLLLLFFAFSAAFFLFSLFIVFFILSFRHFLLLLHPSLRQKASKPAPSPVKVKLESGSLLMMNPPTNDFWYHALPKRSLASAPDARINMTFRQMILMKR